VLGAKVEILGKTLADKQAVWNTDTFHYETPVRLEKVSGDNQKGAVDEFLSDSLKVKVMDYLRSAQARVPVTFEVTGGGGSVERKTVLTDERGIAATRWKLGDGIGLQGVNATAKKPDGQELENSPVDFAAVIEQGLPKVTTSSATFIDDKSIVTGGNVTADGGSKVTERGVCWGISKNPNIILNQRTVDGSGLGSFTSSIAGLASNTTYYVRAYATNASGTTYGNEIIFKTKDEISLPNITTATVKNITSTSAETGGIVWDEGGGGSVIARGVCYSTIRNPTIADFKTEDGKGKGPFVSHIRGLKPNTTYYFRAYATNIKGTAYGNEINFIARDQKPESQKSIAIGNQIWMVKNLDVTTYRNGDTIPQATDVKEFSRLTSGAWIYQNNDPALGAIYGKLYNWYAVNDPRGLAPAGWHIPSKDEWNTLINTLGGASIAGGKLKDTILYLIPNVGATNSSGFSGLPGGILWGGFSGVGGGGFWWSSTIKLPRITVYGESYSFLLYWNKEEAIIGASTNNYGLSVRCIKD
jgi:uncharacterized protein (TIGR02145 family)